MAEAAPRPAEGDAAGLGRPRSVRSVVDGDTLVLDDGERVRLVGIDTPELRHEHPEVRRMARAARQQLARRLAGHRVVLEVALPPRDRHGRTLAYVHLSEAGGGPGEDVGASLLASGHAQPFPTLHPRQEAYRALAREAREAGRGLWAGDLPRVLGLVVEADITPEQAATHLGRRVRVSGRVTSTHVSDDALFLRVGPRDGGTGGASALSVVLFADRVRPPADAARRWNGLPVTVTGRLQEYRGRPQIVLEHVDDLELLPVEPD